MDRDFGRGTPPLVQVPEERAKHQCLDMVADERAGPWIEANRKPAAEGRSHAGKHIVRGVNASILDVMQVALGDTVFAPDAQG